MIAHRLNASKVSRHTRTPEEGGAQAFARFKGSVCLRTATATYMCCGLMQASLAAQESFRVLSGVNEELQSKQRIMHAQLQQQAQAIAELRQVSAGYSLLPHARLLEHVPQVTASPHIRMVTMQPWQTYKTSFAACVHDYCAGQALPTSGSCIFILRRICGML